MEGDEGMVGYHDRHDAGDEELGKGKKPLPRPVFVPCESFFFLLSSLVPFLIRCPRVVPENSGFLLNLDAAL